MRAGPVAIITPLFLAEVTVVFESVMVYAALPTLIRTFGDPIMAGWLLTSHMLLATASIPVAGRLGDIMGRKKTMLLLIAIATAGSILSALSDDFLLVLIGRGLQGLSAAVLPLAIGVMRESLRKEQVPLGVGLLTTAQGVGTAAGLVLGGVIVDRLDWHWLFVASAVLLVLSFVAVALMVPAKAGTPPREPIDWIEGLLPAPAIGALLYGLTMMKQKGLLEPSVLAWLGAGLLLLVWWARRSLGNREPFIDLRLLAGRNMMIANGTKVLAAMGTMQLVFIFSTYVQAPTWTLAGLGLTATVAGLIMLPPNILALFAGTFSGWLTGKAGVRLPLLLGAGVAAAGWLIGLALPGLVMVMLLLCVIMCGTAMMQAGVPNLIVASVPNHRTGEAIGTMAVVQGMANAIGTQIIALMMASYSVMSPDGGAAFPSATSFRLAIGWIAALTIIAMLLSLAIRRQDEAGEKGRAPDMAPADA